jgi:hypothetical protein
MTPSAFHNDNLYLSTNDTSSPTNKQTSQQQTNKPTTKNRINNNVLDSIRLGATRRRHNTVRTVRGHSQQLITERQRAEQHVTDVGTPEDELRRCASIRGCLWRVDDCVVVGGGARAWRQCCSCYDRM